jgi:predicted outer membrane repeat protein
VTDNIAFMGPGGGVFAMGHARVRVDGYSNVTRNSAGGLGGGGLAAVGNASITITGGSNVQ